MTMYRLVAFGAPSRPGALVFRETRYIVAVDERDALARAVRIFVAIAGDLGLTYFSLWLGSKLLHDQSTELGQINGRYQPGLAAYLNDQPDSTGFRFTRAYGGTTTGI